MNRLLCICALLIISFSADAQSIDSLANALKSAQQDSNQVNLLVKLIEETGKSDLNAALAYSNQAIDLSRDINYKTGEMQAQIATGIAYTRFTKFNEALTRYSNALQLAKETGHQRGLARCYNNMAIIYYNESNFPRALECNLLALQINEKLGYKKGIAKNLTNLANIYDTQGNPDKALEYYLRSLRIMEETNDAVSVAAQLANIAIAYYNKKEYERALDYGRRALRMQADLQDSAGYSNTLSTVGNGFKYLHKADSAEYYYKKAIALDQQLNRQRGLAINTGNLGQLYLETGKRAKGIALCEDAIRLAGQSQSLDVIQEAHRALSQAYESAGDAKNALYHYRQFIATRDSIFNEENTKKLVRSEMNFEFEKKEAATRAEQEKKDAVAAAEKYRQRLLLLSISLFGLLVLAFAVFAYRSYLQKKKANKAIIHQKHLIEQKQKEILDSIYYARRIQRSLLPSEQYMARAISQLKSSHRRTL